LALEASNVKPVDELISTSDSLCLDDMFSVMYILVPESHKWLKFLGYFPQLPGTSHKKATPFFFTNKKANKPATEQTNKLRCP
jgi:hypothetical protein